MIAEEYEPTLIQSQTPYALRAHGIQLELGLQLGQETKKIIRIRLERREQELKQVRKQISLLGKRKALKRKQRKRKKE